MFTCLVGHRGVGKSTLLIRLKKIFPEAMCLDLDSEIEKQQALSVSDIFKTFGEEYFRGLEKQTLQFLAEKYSNSNVYIAVGAGFEGPLPKGACALWVRRETDRDGRLFMNRPLINYQARFNERQRRYSEWATETLTLREHLDADGLEDSWFLDSLRCSGGCLTLFETDVNSVDFETFVKRRLVWGVERFELRDDLLSQSALEKAHALIPAERCLYSFREKEASLPKWNRDIYYDFDEPLLDNKEKYSEFLGSKNIIISVHSSAENFVSSLARVNTLGQQYKSALIKFSPEISGFDCLMRGHEWSLQSSQNIFLPRSNRSSEHPRFQWYRLLTKSRSWLSFFREGEGSSLDQPTLLQWVATASCAGGFAAVLGEPVHHSYSPVFHEKFFSSKSLPFFAIPVAASEWPVAMVALEKLGLVCAAVTSPLKKLAFNFTESKEPATVEYESVNTLFFNGRWRGTNTDIYGLKVLVCEAKPESMVVWGGGGTLEIMRAVLKGASFYEARTGNLRFGPASFAVKTLIWAAGESDCEPDPYIRPELVIDLSYRENSRGLEFAQKIGARYVSGRAMFRQQALEQQKFWDK